MAAQEITVDTGILSADIEELKSALASARTQADEMFTQVAELDAMWDGPANAEFIRQFNNDYENTKNLCNTVDSIIKCMEYARDQYNICENEVNGIVAAISV